jgi:hypothetical protein
VFEVWRNCKFEEEAFREHFHIWRLPCVQIRDLEDRTQYLDPWDAEHEKIDAAVRKRGQRILAQG